MATTGISLRNRRVLADLVARNWVVEIALVVGAAAIVGLLAQISFPMPGSPVPVTGQTLGVLLAGSALGWWRGGLSMLVYMGAGVAGVPWFAQHTSGWPTYTGGYLIGFVLAAALCGFLSSLGADRNVFSQLGSMLIGEVVIYAIGVPVLAHALHISVASAMTIGCWNYLPGDALKMAIAAGLLPVTWHFIHRARGAAR